MKNLNILSDAAGVLVAEQKPQSIGPVPVILLIISACLSVWFVRAKQWKLLVFPFALVLIILLPLALSRYPTYKLVVDQSKGTITSVATLNGRQLSALEISATDLTSAEIQFNRGARTIVLVRRDGALVYPLGEQQLQDEPNQYIVLNALRGVIGRVPRDGLNLAAP